ncbi:TetR family transcriptional regulator [Bosea sp. Tri-44]|uniref:TetR/AcrR family transcriptional regulator n=1 Tax=Bosea sp. Tri-44 TaxID=1972137 RepID=UPI00100FF696|nr:TetR/AcrR family transcriptional regulator [Bosea sp. Tri-44]RXT48206.1 TetR family transcriptional regulator [Bosea sp. Tri-44]
MARPLSEAKREAILAAACKLVAELGTGAPTAKIAREAGLAEGTLFTYFANKDELLNQLYLELKTDFAKLTVPSYPANGSVRDRFEHFWNGFIDWGAKFPAKRKALRQLAVSDRITPETRGKAATAFAEISAMFEQGHRDGVLKNQPQSFIGAVLDAMGTMTLDLIAQEPTRHEHYRKTGFAVFWDGISA